MTGLVQKVRRALDPKCLVKKLNKGGCKVVMTGAPAPRLIVDFDKPGSPLAAPETRCDYLLVAQGADDCGWVVPLELKRGRLHAAQVIRQLQQGACAAERLIPQNEPVRFRPVVVSGNRRKHELNMLKEKSNRVRFHARTEPVRLMSCEAPLVRALRLRDRQAR